MNDAVSLQNLLRQFLRDTGLEHKVREYAVPDYWREIVGERIASLSEIKYFENGQLFIEVQAAVWRSEILMRREEIRKKINERCGVETVKEIIIR